MSVQTGVILVVAALSVALVVAIAGVVRTQWGGRRRRRARRRAVVEFAAQGGHQYVASSPERVRYFSVPPFGTGRSRRVTDVVYGQIDGIVFETFAYTFKTDNSGEGGDSWGKGEFQITWIPLPQALPTMRLRPDDALWRISRTLGARDLDTESEEFNQVWKVWCEDERVGHAVLTPTMIELLLEPDYRGRVIALEGRALMTYQRGHTDLRHAPGLVHWLERFRAAIPTFLLERQS